MKYTLLIWQEIPEYLQLYLIPEDVAQTYQNYLDEAHNRLINCDEMNDGMRFINS